MAASWIRLGPFLLISVPQEVLSAALFPLGRGVYSSHPLLCT